MYDLGSWLEFQTCYAALIGTWSPHRNCALLELPFFLSNSVILPGCFLSLYIRLFFPCSLPPSFDFPSKISRSETRTSEATNFPEDKYHGCNSQVLVIACSMLLLSILHPQLYGWASLGMCRLVAHLSQKCPFFFLCFLSHGVQPRSREIRGHVARM